MDGERRAKPNLNQLRRNGTLDVIRERDGDACRFCGMGVEWGNQKGDLGGSYEVYDAAKPPAWSNLVVCCRRCKKLRQPGSKHILPPRKAVVLPARVSKPHTSPPGWTAEACDDWQEAYGGGDPRGCVAPGGVIGKALKPLEVRIGWQRLRPVWRFYLKKTPPAFASPPRFANTFGALERELAGGEMSKSTSSTFSAVEAELGRIRGEREE